MAVIPDKKSSGGTGARVKARFERHRCASVDRFFILAVKKGQSKGVSATVKPIPEGHQGAIPYLTVSNASEAIAFYKAAFGAAEMLCIEHGGKVGHAELEIGEARIMLCDEFPDHDALSPKTIGGTPVMIHLYVEDVDAFTARAIGAGIKVLRPVTDQFYGERGGKFEDPSGHRWWIATHKVDISLEELQNRAAALFGGDVA
jgi:PhnB protein